jgi:hypothetical protein
VDLALDDRASAQRPERCLDPISLGGLIVSVATLAWTVYTDHRKDANPPTPETVVRTIRVQIPDTSHVDGPTQERIIEIVVAEAARTADIDTPATRTPEDGGNA